MNPRGSEKNEEPRQPSRQHGTEPWSQEDLDLLHDMVDDYKNARWFRRRMKLWGIWVLGIPAAVVAFWDPIEKIIRKVGLLLGLAR